MSPINKIAVPLDGSLLAEQAVPYAIELAKVLQAQLLLLRLKNATSRLQGFLEYKNKKQMGESAEEYLADVSEIITDPALFLHLPATTVQTMATYCDTPGEIADIAAGQEVGLIIMTTHGRTGLPRLVSGSVATSVVECAKVPVILIRPEETEENRSLLQILAKDPHSEQSHEDEIRLLVMLDGTPEAEAVLEPALELAQKLNGIIYLLRVVQPDQAGDYYSGWYPFETGNQAFYYLDASAYLDRIEAQLCERGQSCITILQTGQAADEILNYASKLKAFLLVMATRACSQSGRFLLGGVVEEVVSRSHLPVMLVHTYDSPLSPTTKIPAKSKESRQSQAIS